MTPRSLLLLSALVSILGAAADPARADSAHDDKLVRATEVFGELLSTSPPPARLLDESSCIAVVPRVFEGAIGLGGRQGKGVLSCRRPSGEWSPPVFLKLTGGSIGLQVGFHCLRA